MLSRPRLRQTTRVSIQISKFLRFLKQTSHELLISVVTDVEGTYLLEGDGERDPSALLQRLHHLLGDLTPRTADSSTCHNLSPRRPRRFAGFHPLYHVQQQLRWQVGPPPLLLRRPLLDLALPPCLLLARPEDRPRMPRPSAAVAGAPRHAPDAVPHLLELPHNALQRHCSLLW
jgi:hypothetical protein